MDDLSNKAEVAVIIPTYNCAHYLPRALESVFAQTYRDYRVFVVDDGSIDDTAAVVERYANRLTFIQQAHAGAAAARNRGIKASSSPYVAFLDADDVWLPAKLERQMKLFDNHPEIGLVGAGFLHDGVVYSAEPQNGSRVEALLKDCCISTPAAVVRRQCLYETGLFYEPLRVCEDYNLWIRIASRWSFAIVREVLVHCYSTSGNLSSSTSPEDRLRFGIAALQHVLATCPQLSQHEKCIIQRAMAVHYYNLGCCLLSQGDRRGGRAAMEKAWRFNRLNWKAPVKLSLSVLPPAGLKSATWVWRNLIARPKTAVSRPSN